MSAAAAAAVPRTLDAAGIAARIPHAGAMALLARLRAWDERTIDCDAADHTRADHPLRGAHGLHAVHAVELASQSMALHGTLCAERDRPGTLPVLGFLAAVRGVRLAAVRLDAAPAPLRVRAERLLGDARQAQYAFTLDDAAGRRLAEGRATVILQALPGASPPPPP